MWVRFVPLLRGLANLSRLKLFRDPGAVPSRYTVRDVKVGVFIPSAWIRIDKWSAYLNQTDDLPLSGWMCLKNQNQYPTLTEGERKGAKDLFVAVHLCSCPRIVCGTVARL